MDQDEQTAGVVAPGANIRLPARAGNTAQYNTIPYSAAGGGNTPGFSSSVGANRGECVAGEMGWGSRLGLGRRLGGRWAGGMRAMAEIGSVRPRSRSGAGGPLTADPLRPAQLSSMGQDLPLRCEGLVRHTRQPSIECGDPRGGTACLPLCFRAAACRMCMFPSTGSAYPLLQHMWETRIAAFCADAEREHGRWHGIPAGMGRCTCSGNWELGSF